MLLKTPMLTDFEEKLAAMTQEEFNALWQEITEKNKDVQGPTAKELIASFRPGQEQFIREACQAGTLGEPLALTILLGIPHREAFLDELRYVPGVVDVVQGAIIELANGQALSLSDPVCDQPAFGYHYVRIVGLTADGQYRVESVDGEPQQAPLAYDEFQPKTLIAVYRTLIGEVEVSPF